MPVESRTRRGHTTFREILSDPLTDCTLEMVQTLRLPSVLRPLPQGTPSLIHEVRQYLHGTGEPIIVSWNTEVLCDLYEMVSKHAKMFQNVRDAYALVNHRFHDVMFLGGIDSRNHDKDPETIWILYPDEYADFKTRDPDAFLKALSIIPPFL